MTQAEMIEGEDDWPEWPILPMKRGEPPAQEMGLLPAKAIQHELAYHLSVPEATYSVFRFNLFDLDPGDMIAELAAAPHHDYGSVAALLADGWIVD